MSIQPTKVFEKFIAQETVSGFLAWPEEQRVRPGVLVLHEGSGLNDFTKEQARRLAAAGFVAFAPDLFGQPVRDRSDAAALIGGLVADRLRLRRRTRDALDWLRAMPGLDAEKIVAVGFCFGGLAALEMARAGQEIRAAVSFHGGLSSSGLEPTPITARILVCTGADDPFAGPEQRLAFQREMTERKADWQMLILAQTKHAFMNPAADPSVQPGCAYQATSARRSWRAMLALFEEITGNAVNQNSAPDLRRATSSSPH